MNFLVNDIVFMKKSHPCGNYSWKILRIGADVKIQCCKCGQLVMMPKSKFEKSLK